MDRIFDNLEYKGPFGEIFSEGNFSKLPNISKSKKKFDTKVQQVRKYIEINLLHSIYCVKLTLKPEDVSFALGVLEQYKNLFYQIIKN